MLGIRRTTKEFVPLSAVKPLGQVGPHEYVTLPGSSDEFLLEGVVDHPADLAEVAGERFISVPVVFTENGVSMRIGSRYRRALPLPAGSYQRALEAARSKSAPTTTRRPLDKLAGLRLLRPRPDFGAPMADRSARGLLPAVGGDPRLGFAPGHGPIRGRGIFALVESLATAEELPTYEGKPPAGLAELLREAAPLWGDYPTTGKWPSCELPHGGAAPEAWTLIWSLVPPYYLRVCQDHAEGTAH